MGLGGISIWQLLIILVIVLLLFGTKRLKTLGSDLGNAVKGFRSAVTDAESEKDKDEEQKRLDEQAATKPEAAAREATAAPKERDKV